MPRRPLAPPDKFLDVPFPTLGLNVVTALVAQPPGTTANTVNCRAWEPTTQRNRGGSRPGLIRWRLVQVNGANIVQDLNVIAVSVGATPGSTQGATVSTGPGGYYILATAVSNGKLRFAVSGDTGSTDPLKSPFATWYHPNVDTQFFTTGLASPTRSAVNTQMTFSATKYPSFTEAGSFGSALYMVNGHLGSATFWDPSGQGNATTAANGGTLYNWSTLVTHWAANVASVSNVQFPNEAVNSGTAFSDPSLICTWRGRSVLAGLVKDPNNWFMSAVGNPLDFNYLPASPSATQAVAGHLSLQGMLGDPVTALIPYTDDVLIFGGQHSIWMMQGDPMAGGAMQLITSSIGILFGNSWCMDPYGNIFFMSNRGGVYQLVPGSQPQRISQQIEPLISQVNQQVSNVRLVWNDQQQGVHLFITPTVPPTTATGGPEMTQHFFYDMRNGGWWLDFFANNYHNPFAVVQMDGQAPTDRVPLLGGSDGYVRSIPATAPDDDGTSIQSNIYLGPILTADMDDVLLKDLQVILGSTSGPVTGFIAVGDTAEHALASSPLKISSWFSGRNLDTLVRRAGHAIYIVITGANQWIFEGCRANVRGEGLIRKRGH
jgi:hypothetical protein